MRLLPRNPLEALHALGPSLYAFLTSILSDPKALREIDERRSPVTDKIIPDQFPFGEVMAVLARQTGDAGHGPLVIYRQWWATQPRATCPLDDLLFGFPYACRKRPPIWETTTHSTGTLGATFWS